METLNFQPYVQTIYKHIEAHQLNEEYYEQTAESSKPKIHPKGSYIIREKNGNMYIVSETFFNNNFKKVFDAIYVSNIENVLEENVAEQTNSENSIEKEECNCTNECKENCTCKLNEIEASDERNDNIS